MYDHGAHYEGRKQDVTVGGGWLSATHVLGVEFKASAKKASGILGLTDVARKELIERVNAGEHVELDIDAEVFRYEGKPIRGLTFSRAALQQLHRSAADTPIQRGHDVYGPTHGRVLSATMETTGKARVMVEKMRLVTPSAVIGHLNGTDRQYSVGIQPLNAEKSIICTHCNQPALKVGHWPGMKLEGKGGEMVTVGWHYTEVRLKETSITAFPQVRETGIRAGHRALSDTPAQERIMELTEMGILLNCAPTEAAIRAAVGELQTVGALGADLQAKHAAQGIELTAALAKVLELSMVASQAQTGALVATLREDGYMVKGGETEKRVLELHAAGNITELTRLSAMLSERAGGVPTGKRQSADVNTPTAAGEPPLDDKGAVDFVAMFAMLKPDTRKVHAEMVKNTSCAALFSHGPASAHLWAECGIARPQ